MPRMSMMKQGSICQFPEERQGRCAYRDLLLQRDLNSHCISLGRLSDNLRSERKVARTDQTNYNGQKGVKQRGLLARHA